MLMSATKGPHPDGIQRTILSKLIAAGRAASARLQPFVSAGLTPHQVPFRPGEYVYKQSEQAHKKDKQHPKYSAVHPSCFRISCHPYQDGDIYHENYYRQQDNNAASCGACGGCGFACGYGCGGLFIRHLTLHWKSCRTFVNSLLR